MYDAERLLLVERTLVALFDDDERDVVYAEFLLVADVRDCVAVATLRVDWLPLDVLLLPVFTVLLLLVPTLWLRLAVVLPLLVCTAALLREPDAVADGRVYETEECSLLSLVYCETVRVLSSARELLFDAETLF